jgi:hypothetical protein
MTTSFAFRVPFFKVLIILLNFYTPLKSKKSVQWLSGNQIQYIIAFNVRSLFPKFQYKKCLQGNNMQAPVSENQ